MKVISDNEMSNDYLNYTVLNCPADQGYTCTITKTEEKLPLVV